MIQSVRVGTFATTEICAQTSGSPSETLLRENQRWFASDCLSPTQAPNALRVTDWKKEASRHWLFIVYVWRWDWSVQRTKSNRVRYKAEVGQLINQHSLSFCLTDLEQEKGTGSRKISFWDKVDVCALQLARNEKIKNRKKDRESEHVLQMHFL